MTDKSCYDCCKTHDLKSDCTDCKSDHSKTKKALLECGQEAGTITFTSPSDKPFQIANITIDLSCFCKPIVNIEFSSIVSFEKIGADGTDVTVRLRFELFRSCDKNTIPMPRGVWMYEVADVESNIEGKLTRSFGFNFCESVTCPGCCLYFVAVTPVEVTVVPVVRLSATVSNARIAALAQEG